MRLHLSPAADASGHPWLVELSSVQEEAERTETVGVKLAKDGICDFASLLPGVYRVTVRQGSQAQWYSETIDITGDEERQITIHAALVRGTVRLGDHPIRATLWFGGDKGMIRVPIRTNDSGQYAVRVPQLDGDTWPEIDVVASNAEQNVSSAEQKVSYAEQKVSCAEQKVSYAEQKVSCAEQKVSCAEQKVSSAEQKVSSAEQKVSSAEQKVSSAWQNVRSAEQNVSSAEQEVSSAEQKVSSSRARICSRLLPEQTVMLPRINKMARESFRAFPANRQPGSSIGQRDRAPGIKFGLNFGHA